MALYNPVSVSIPSNTSSVATPTSVASTATNGVLLAANANRKGSTIYNSSTARLYVALGAVASLTAFTALLEAGGYYEVPFWFTGAINGIWATANGNALITELS